MKALLLLFLIVGSHILGATNTVYAARTEMALSGIHARLAAHDLIGRQLSHEHRSFKKFVYGAGETMPDMELRENQEAFDDYIDNLLAGTVTADHQAEWDELDARLRRIGQTLLAKIHDVQDFTGHAVEDIGEGLADAVQSAKDVVDKAFDGIVRAAHEGLDALENVANSLRRIVHDQPNLTAWEIVSHVIVGFANGFTLGGAEFLRAWIVPGAAKPPPDPTMQALIAALADVGREIKMFFGGVFGKREARSGKTRIQFVNDSLKSLLRAIGKVFSELWMVITSSAFLIRLKPIFLSMFVLTLLSAAMLTFPGIGWFMKLAGMVITFVLAGYRFLSNTLPRFIRAAGSCIQAGLVCSKQAAVVMIEMFAEIIGLFTTITLAGFPDKATGFPGIKGAFDGNEYAKASQLVFRPSWVDSSNLFRKAISGVIAGNKVSGLNKLLGDPSFTSKYS